MVPQKIAGVESIRLGNLLNLVIGGETHDRMICDSVQRQKWATPGRGLRTTRDSTANPGRFPALAPVIWFGNPTFINSKISGQLRRTRSDGWPCHCAPAPPPLRPSR